MDKEQAALATEVGLEEKERIIRLRTKAIRRAVKTIYESSIDWSYEIETALAGMSEEERTAFVVTAGRACGMLGDFIAVAGGAR
jgi:hypothetical protein